MTTRGQANRAADRAADTAAANPAHRASVPAAPSSAPAPSLEAVGPLSTAEVARLDTSDLMEMAARAFRVRCSQDAVLATVCGELDRREDWRASGATSLGGLARVQHLGRFGRNGSDLCAVSVRGSSIDLPHLADGLADGQISLNLDKVRSVLGVATPHNEAGWAEAATELSCKDLRRPGALQAGSSSLASDAAGSTTNEIGSVQRCACTPSWPGSAAPLLRPGQAPYLRSRQRRRNRL